MKIANFQKEISTYLKQADSLPYLFIGSGMSKRYLNAPDWSTLLNKIADYLFDGNQYKVQQLKLKAKQKYGSSFNDEMTLFADLLEEELINEWPEHPKYNESRTIYGEQFISGVSPLKLEIAKLLKSLSNLDEHTTEIEHLKRLSDKSIAGIITTNYDSFLEEIFNFKVYKSQQDLLFHVKYNIGEIYKIHGTVEEPASIVITSNDYSELKKRNQYVAAKLLTTFIEHPIFFLGYSIEDEDVRQVLKDIQLGLSDKQFNELQNRLFFIEWDSSLNEPEMKEMVFSLDSNRSLKLTRITMNDYSPLYEILSKNKTKYPVSLIRKIQDDMYRMVITKDLQNKILVNTPGNFTDSTDNELATNVEFVYGVGVIDIAKKGYTMFTSAEIYKDTVLDNNDYDSNQLLKFTIPNLLVQSSLPLYKYISNSKDITSEAELNEKIRNNLTSSFNDFKNKSILKRKKYVSSVMDALSQFESKSWTISKLLQQLETLNEDEINVSDLESFLKNKLTETPDLLTNKQYKSTVSMYRKLIREYDYLKYKKSIPYLRNETESTP